MTPMGREQHYEVLLPKKSIYLAYDPEKSRFWIMWKNFTPVSC